VHCESSTANQKKAGLAVCRCVVVHAAQKHQIPSGLNVGPVAPQFVVHRRWCATGTASGNTVTVTGNNSSAQVFFNDGKTVTATGDDVHVTCPGDPTCG